MADQATKRAEYAHRHRPPRLCDAVLFDLDGTLLDSLEDLADSMNEVLRSAGFPGHSTAAYRYFVGDGMEVLVRRAVPADRADEAMVGACLAAMREEYGRRYAVKTRPYPGVPELLDGLEARGVRTAVFTNKPHDAAVQMVGKLLGRWRFEQVLGQRPGFPRKPDPSGALEVTRRMGLDARRFLYLGDTATDMLTARAAGMRPVGALWGFRTREELEAAGAEVLIETPPELLEHL
ncbi:MAG: HAD family hydrolase [Deltaproteobacteria bacterium]|nr:HAD family hydrolase [Deltaproteobacteria bacterium]